MSNNNNKKKQSTAKKVAAKKNTSSNSQQQNRKKQTVEDLMAQGIKYAEQYKIELAVESFKKANTMAPDNTTIIDTLAELLLELGELEEAKQYFITSVRLNPNDSYTKYMNLGQLLGGQDAIKSYSKAIEMMQLELSNLLQQPTTTTTNTTTKKNNVKKQTDKMDDTKEEEEEEEDENIWNLKDQLSSAFCSLAELYLTDECFDDNAEVECEKHLKSAISYAPYSPEPYSLLASMKISQVKNEEALQLLKHSHSLWSELEIEDLPSLEYRYGVAQMFIELNQNEEAAIILETLVDEQDNIAEIWYALGLVYDHLGDARSSLDCLENSQKLLKIAHDGTDKELETQITTLLVKVKHQVSLLPPEEEEDDVELEATNDDEEDEEME